jgi:hypothetical protein
MGRRGSSRVRPVRVLLQTPIIVDVGPQSETSADISLQFVVGMFEMAGVVLLVAAVGSLLVAGAVILFKRRRGGALSSGGTSHTRLRIDEADQPQARLHGE